MPAPARKPLERIQSGALAALTSLPGSVQRLLSARRTVQIDGQTMAPETQLLLTVLKYQPKPKMVSLTPPEARPMMAERISIAGGRPLPVAQVNDLTVAGGDGPIRARLYRPTTADQDQPAIVFFHGGGFVIGDIDTHDQVCRFLAVHSDVTVVSIDYRLAPEHKFPAAVDDALAAFLDVHARAAELGLDPQRIAVGGDSAGGQLAAVTCLLARDQDGQIPAFQLLLYPVTDQSTTHPSMDLFGGSFFAGLSRADIEYYTRNFLPEGADTSDPRISPLRAASHANLPPAYVATAGFDVLRDEGEAYAEALRNASVPTQSRRHAGLIHGFANMLAAGRPAQLALAEAAAALRHGLTA